VFPDPLRAFQKVVRLGSIRKASDDLALAPSSVSRQIAILERQMGTQLINRSISGISLTHAGELVADYADSVVGGFDSLRLDLDDLRGVARLITVSMVESISSSGPGRAAERFCAAFPNVSFNYDIVPAPAVFEAVRTQQSDIGIAFGSQGDAQVSIEARVPEPIVLLAAAGHPLADRDFVRVEELKATPLALPAKSFKVRQLLDHVCQDEGIVIVPVMQTNSFEILRDFVRCEMGAAVLPSRAAAQEVATGRSRIIPIRHSVLEESTLDLIVRRQRRVPRLIRLFVKELARSIAGE